MNGIVTLAQRDLINDVITHCREKGWNDAADAVRKALEGADLAAHSACYGTPLAMAGKVICRFCRTEVKIRESRFEGEEQRDFAMVLCDHYNPNDFPILSVAAIESGIESGEMREMRLCTGARMPVVQAV